MLLKNKKVQGDEQNWCVVLNPVRSEIDKKNIAQKISSVFSLSYEEATDLVNNTPIILLDNLSQPLAQKIKDYFQSAGADMTTTNDVFRKRKYYRTVWPSQPSLSFLYEWKNHEDARGEQALNPDEALNEIRSLHKTKISDFSPPEPSLGLRENEKTTPEIEPLQPSYENLHKELSPREPEVPREAMPDYYWQNLVNEKDREIKELRSLMSNTEERFEVLKEEYRQARILFEDKIHSLIQDNEKFKKRLQDISESETHQSKEKETWSARFAEKEKQITDLKQQLLSFEQRSQEKLEGAVREREKQISELKSEVLGFEQRAQEKAEGALREKEEQAQLLRQLQDKVQSLLQEKNGWDEAVRQQKAQGLQLQEKYESLLREFDHMRRLGNEEKEAWLKKQRETEYLIQSAENKNAELLTWQSKCRDLEKKVQEMQQLSANGEERRQVERQQLELAHKELEALRQQLREVSIQTEQRETQQRKAQIANQLAEKENYLRKLVKDQEKIESEIHDREEAMRKILSEQESVEKEIIEGKQTLRHVNESIKREKPARPSFVAPEHDLNSGEPEGQGSLGL